MDWGFYERLLELVGEGSGIRIAYDGKDLEVMVVGPTHEDVSEFASDLVKVIVEELEIPFRAMRSTTWKREAVKRGIEADQSFYFLPEKLAAAAARLRKSDDVADFPNPDLAIEIDMSRPKVDRQGIYAALKVMEIWRFGAIGMTIERLTDQGNYVAVDASGFLPISREEVVRWVLQEDFSDVSAWKRRLRAWVRAELIPRAAR